MSSALTRGFALMNQGRLDLAEKEFRQALSEDPDESVAHAFLALCLTARDLDAEALKEADEAVRLSPDSSLSHSVRARVLLGLKRFREAEISATESIRLDPDSVSCRVILGHIAIARQKPAEALEIADEALRLDAQDVDSRNLRAIALTQLGRKEEAAITLGEALAEDPEDALSHANQGWVYLHKNDHNKALEHFREALRLEPNLEWARVGIIESLKSRYLVYRLMLRFFLWMGRQTQVAQWAVILTILVIPRILTAVDKSAPFLKGPVLALRVLVFAFVILTWISSPLFNFLLRFNKFGRMALSPEEKWESSWIGGFVVLALGFTVAYFATNSDLAFLGMAIFGFMLFPLRVAFMVPQGRPRLIAGAVATGLFLLCIPLVSWSLVGSASPFFGLRRSEDFFLYFVWGSVASSWLPMLLHSRESFR